MTTIYLMQTKQGKYKSVGDGKNEIKIKKFSDVGLRKKEIHLNGKKTTAKNHYGSLNMIMFSPEDLQIVKGDPSLRRKFLDMEIAQTNRIYYELLVKYNKNLKQRNKLLKEIKEQKANISLLDPWNEEISTLAAQILIIRIENLKKLNTLANSIYNNITANKENLIIKYELKANNGELIYPEEKSLEEWKDFYKESLKARVDKDVYRGYTAIGPHRDDLNICIDDFSVRSYGSQGQQRSCALALKFSQIEYIYDQIGEYPVLLLDDVMSELDHFRREQILNFISNKVQTFITVNDKSLIPLIPDSEFFEVENGVIKEAEHE